MERKIIIEARQAAAEDRYTYASDLIWEHCIDKKYKRRVDDIISQRKVLDLKGIEHLRLIKNRTAIEHKIIMDIFNLLNMVELDLYVNAQKTTMVKLSDEKIALILTRLLETIKGGGIVSYKLAIRLRLRIEERLEFKNALLNHKNFFEKIYNEMTPSEFGLHNAVRDYTEGIRYRYYLRALKLVLNNDNFGKTMPSYFELRKYLLVWVAKFESEFIPNEKVFVIEIEKTDPPFPSGIIDELKALRKRIA